MLTEICAYIKNYFAYEEDKHTDAFAIVDGRVTPFIDFTTDYIRIVGSHKNDGVHRISDNDLIDEPEFEGAIWIMSPPKAFIGLVAEIEDWQAKNGSQVATPYNSESFGGYSYSKATTASGNAAGWQQAYGTRLNAYRKVRA